MAKPRPDKSQILREALTANPDLGNAELVELINDSSDRIDDKLVFTVADVTAEKKAMKKGRTATEALPPPAPEPTPETPAPQREAAPGRQSRPKQAPAAQPNPVDLIDKVFDLAKECGGFEHLKRLVDRIAELRGR